MPTKLLDAGRDANNVDSTPTLKEVVRKAIVALSYMEIYIEGDSPRNGFIKTLEGKISQDLHGPRTTQITKDPIREKVKGVTM